MLLSADFEPSVFVVFELPVLLELGVLLFDEFQLWLLHEEPELPELGLG